MSSPEAPRQDHETDPSVELEAPEPPAAKAEPEARAVSPTPRHRRLRLKLRWFGSLLARDWWWIAIVALAVWVRLPGLEKPFHHDEWQTLWKSESFADLRHYFPEQLTAHVAAQVLHRGSLVEARWVYLIVGLAAIPVAWSMGRVWGDWFAGFLLATAMALWPFKVYWDTTMREYAVWMLFALLMLVLLESWRRRPTLLRFSLACVACLLSTQAHQAALVIIFAPGVYLAWELLRQPIRLLHRKRRWDPLWQLPFRLALMACVYGLAVLLAVQTHRGSDEVLEMVEEARTALILEHEDAESGSMLVGGDRPHLTKPDSGPQRSRKPDRVLRLAAKNEARAPSIDEALLFVERGLRTVFSQPQNRWTGADLLWLKGGDLTAWDTLMTGPINTYHTHPQGSPLQRTVLWAMLIGSLLILFRSPPLVVTCWGLFFANGLIVYVHKTHVPELVGRYYTLSGLCALVLMVGGLAVACGWLRAPLRRWRPRWNAALVLVLAPALLFAGTCFGSEFLRASASYWYRGWADPSEQGILRIARDKFPLGALIYGMGNKNVEFLRRWEFYQYRRDKSGFWASPARIQLLDAWQHRFVAGRALLDRLNAFQGLVTYIPRHVTNFEPTRNVAHLLPVERTLLRGRWLIETAPIGRKVFVMRGGTTLPLMQRLAVDDGGDPPALEMQATRYQLDCHFETPGHYELAIDHTPTCTPVAVLIEGTTIPAVLRSSEVSALAWDLRAETAFREDNDFVTTRTPTWLEPYIDVLDAGPPPIFHGTASQTVFRFHSGDKPLDVQPLSLTLIFDRPPSSAAPRLVFSRMDERFNACTDIYRVGEFVYYPEPSSLTFGLPMKLVRETDKKLSANVFLVDNESRETITGWANMFNMRQRGLETGDILWAGPLQIREDHIRSHLGRSLALTLMPVEVDHKNRQGMYQSRPMLNKKRKHPFFGHYLICYLRFDTVDGGLVFDISTVPF